MLTTCVLANFVFIVHECAANDSIVSFILSVLYQRFHSTCTYTLLVCTMSLYLILAGTSRQLIVDWSRSVVSGDPCATTNGTIMPPSLFAGNLDTLLQVSINYIL